MEVRPRPIVSMIAYSTLRAFRRHRPAGHSSCWSRSSALASGDVMSCLLIPRSADGGAAQGNDRSPPGEMTRRTRNHAGRLERVPFHSEGDSRHKGRKRPSTEKL
jgi:hypothetical protein